MADIRRVKLPNGTTYNIKDNTARSNINNIVNGTTKLPYGKSLSITNDTELNLLDPNNNILSTVDIPKPFKQAHFEYTSSIRLVIDEVESLVIGDIVYIKQLPASDAVEADSLFYVSDIFGIYNHSAFCMNSGENKADFYNTYVYSISTRYDYIAKVIDVLSNNRYGFEIIAGGPTDDLIKINEHVYQDRVNLINTLGTVLQSSAIESVDEFTQLYLDMYDSNNNKIMPTAEYYGVLANGKVLLQYTCSTAVTKIHVSNDNGRNYMPNFVFGLSDANDTVFQGSCNILYTNNGGIAEGSFVGDSLQYVYGSGASSWDLIFVCDYAYPKIL